MPELRQQPADVAAINLSVQFAERAARFPDHVRIGYFQMAGSLVRAEIVGAPLFEAFARPFSHLRVEPNGTTPDLHIRLWDAHVAGDDHPEPSPGYDPLLGETIVAEDGRYVHFIFPHIRTVLDRHGGTITGIVSSESRLTLHNLGRPMHSELLLWHHDHNLLPVHAGLVARGGDGVLLAGPGGSGKSTTSVLCHLAGFSYLADDYVAVEWRDNGEVHGHSIYNSTHIEPKHLERFPEAITSSAMGSRLTHEDKSLVLLSEAGAGEFSGYTRIRVIGLPIVAHKPRTTVRRASKVETLLRLAPSSLFLMPYQGMGRTGFARLNDLVEAIPAWWIELGEDLQEIPGVVDELLMEAIAS